MASLRVGVKPVLLRWARRFKVNTSVVLRRACPGESRGSPMPAA